MSERHVGWWGVVALFVMVGGFSFMALEASAEGKGVDPANLARAMLIVIGLLVYLVPTFIAVQREHRNQVAIVALNILGGWTLLGWLVALCWSLYAHDDTARS